MEESHNCDRDRGVCRNTISSYQCSCMGGFTGTGTNGTCEGVYSCSTYNVFVATIVAYISATCVGTSTTQAMVVTYIMQHKITYFC